MRMYFFVMYNLSGIQKGIQAGHAALEYILKYGLDVDPRVLPFIRDHKTFIILDGGSSRNMLDRMLELDELGLPYAEFREPDLNDSVSAIAFIVGEDDYAPSDNEVIYQTNEVYEYLRKFRLASN